MPTTPRLHGSKIDPKTSGFRSPEEDELRRKQAELEDLQSKLAESELELATLRSELIAFERRYLEIVGSRYAELDALEAQIAESVARSRPADPTARRNAESARARAQESEEALGDAGRKPSGPGFAPTEELKALYRCQRQLRTMSPPHVFLCIASPTAGGGLFRLEVLRGPFRRGEFWIRWRLRSPASL